MGCASWLFFMTWGMGIMCTIGGFIVQPRSQAPAFFAIGIVCLIAAVFWTCATINAPKREAEAKRKEKLDEQIKREEKEKQLAHVEGLSKYHQMDEEDARAYQEGIAAMRQLGMIMQQSVYQEKEKDWAILGGIAEGIAGPVAGIATAAKAIQDNARINAENAARREWGAKQNAFYQDLASQAEREKPTALSMSELQKRYTAILSWAPSTLFALIKLSNTKIDVDAQTGAVTVSSSWRQDDKSLCIDGALRAKLYTNSGEYAGCAYLVFPKAGTVGFSGELSGICARPKSATNYSVKIEPADLWELAHKGNSASRKTDNLTDDEHRSMVADSEAKLQQEAREASMLDGTSGKGILSEADGSSMSQIINIAAGIVFVWQAVNGVRRIIAQAMGGYLLYTDLRLVINIYGIIVMAIMGGFAFGRKKRGTLLNVFGGIYIVYQIVNVVTSIQYGFNPSTCINLAVLIAAFVLSWKSTGNK